MFVNFGNNVNVVAHYDNNPLWMSADSSKDDLECSIHLKVRLA